MTLQRVNPILFALMVGLPAFSQVQFFEQDVSGLIPHAGFKYSSGIQEYSLGIEYNIDGRISLGFEFAKPVSDTFSFDDKLRAYKVNPYAIFEFVEPGNLNNFSFAIRGDFIHENTNKDTPTEGDTAMLNSFRRTALGGGPMFSLRIFGSEKVTMVPSVFYEFFYVSYHRDKLQNLSGDNDDGYYLWHDLTAGYALQYRFDEFNGVTFDPRIGLEFGEGRSKDDLLSFSVRFGYSRSF